MSIAAAVCEISEGFVHSSKPLSSIIQHEVFCSHLIYAKHTDIYVRTKLQTTMRKDEQDCAYCRRACLSHYTARNMMFRVV